VLGASLALPDAIAKVKGDDAAFGYNVGIMLNLAPTTRIGLSYRSAIEYDVQGDVSFDLPAVSVTNTATVISQVLGALVQPGHASPAVGQQDQDARSFSLSAALASAGVAGAGRRVSGPDGATSQAEFTRTNGTVLNGVEYD
jgi:long-chain fatty acid transport protein